MADADSRPRRWRQRDFTAVSEWVADYWVAWNGGDCAGLSAVSLILIGEASRVSDEWSGGSEE